MMGCLAKYLMKTIGGTFKKPKLSIPVVSRVVVNVNRSFRVKTTIHILKTVNLPRSIIKIIATYQKGGKKTKKTH